MLGHAGKLSREVLERATVEIGAGEPVTIDTIAHFGAEGFKVRIKRERQEHTPCIFLPSLPLPLQLKLLSNDPTALPMLRPVEEAAEIEVVPGAVTQMQLSFEGEQLDPRHACFALSGAREGGGGIEEERW